MTDLIFASGNKGKVLEVRNLFNGSGYNIISLHDLEDVPEIIEDGLTFQENAKKKAKIIFEKYGSPVIADDSGLAVEQLNGEPGVFSARYAGENCTYEDNNRKLLKELYDFPHPHKAKFICCAVYYDDKKYFEAIGELHGVIINDLRGTMGFGYDPVFLPDDYQKTLAELSLEEKNKISHRAKAFIELKKIITNKK